jgi:YfiH family protein
MDEHIEVDLPGARALFTTRRGGVSSGPYESLNLGLSTDDDPAAVRVNRELVATTVGAPLAWARQVHGARARLTGTPGPTGDADAVVTTRPGLAPLVLTADCLPIAVAGDGAVGMIHAGWQGLATGVIDAGVRTIREAGGSGPLAAAIGPGAGPCCYEVGEELFARFDADARRGGCLDLKLIARRQLQAAGVATVQDVGLCTICSDPSLFFSHRRDRGVTGRQGGVAWLS